MALLDHAQQRSGETEPVEDLPSAGNEALGQVTRLAPSAACVGLPVAVSLGTWASLVANLTAWCMTNVVSCCPSCAGR